MHNDSRMIQQVIVGFTHLSPEEQEKVRGQLSLSTSAVEDGSAASDAGKSAGLLPELAIQYSVSSRGQCYSCKQRMPMGLLRISTSANTSKDPEKPYMVVHYYHPICFQKSVNATSIQPVTSVEHLQGWESIDEDHRKYVLECLEGREPEGSVPVKVKDGKDEEGKPTKKARTAKGAKTMAAEDGDMKDASEDAEDDEEEKGKETEKVEAGEPEGETASKVKKKGVADAPGDKRKRK
ncbi:hypothetical protein HDU93_007616 [Gonapodya sp. JEL0774]|nr:hypothetical protein HDU93_007616 [Gonapodya sp. JEL0774]